MATGKQMKSNTKKITREKRNSTVRMDESFDDPDWKILKKEARKIRKKAKKSNPKWNQKPPAISGSTTGGGYMHAMRGLREGDYSFNTSNEYPHIYIPIGISGTTGKSLAKLVAGKEINPRIKKKIVKGKRTGQKTGWYKFTLYAKTGKKLQTRIGEGTMTDAKKIGRNYLGKKISNRKVHRIVIDGPYKSSQNILRT